MLEPSCVSCARLGLSAQPASPTGLLTAERQGADDEPVQKLSQELDNIIRRGLQHFATRRQWADVENCGLKALAQAGLGFTEFSTTATATATAATAALPELVVSPEPYEKNDDDRHHACIVSGLLQVVQGTDPDVDASETLRSAACFMVVAVAVLGCAVVQLEGIGKYMAQLLKEESLPGRAPWLPGFCETVVRGAGEMLFFEKGGPQAFLVAFRSLSKELLRGSSVPRPLSPAPQQGLRPQAGERPRDSAESHSEPPRQSRAYCALLYGSETHFFICALIVGYRLKALCPDADRVLLVAGRWWQNRAARAALGSVFTRVSRLQLINAPHATLTPRHNQVFSKIQVLRLNYRQLILLDIDLVPRADLSPLFDVEAPAGMHHGHSKERLEHGKPISLAGQGGWWCVNAGVMRLDPMPGNRMKRRQVEDMVEEIRKLDYRSCLPEQYYLSDRFDGWRHIDPSWNMEVGPLYEDPGFTWPRKAARRKSAAPRNKRWSECRVEHVKVFHFSGTKYEPWWYAHMSPEEAYEDALERWRHRDPRLLVAVAIREWRTALEEVVADSSSWSENAQRLLLEMVRDLSQESRWWESWREWKAETCGQQCTRCRKMFSDSEGRFLLGWEGWWLCKDCIAGYVFSDELGSPVCKGCGGVCRTSAEGTSERQIHRSGGWVWPDERHLEWYCGNCYH